MASLGTVGVDFEARTRAFNRALDNMTRRMNRLSADTRRTQREVTASTVAIGNAWAMAGQQVVSVMGRIASATVDTIKNSSIMAIQFENDMSQVERIFGNASNSIVMFADNQAKALGMSTADAVAFSRVYGRITTGIIGDQVKSAQITQQLLKQSAVVASATGRTMDDVMTRITSGLRGETEAIEDLQIEVTASMLQTTKAFKKFAGDKSWNQLDDATRKQIRLFGILEQSMKIGTDIQDTTSASLQRLSATFKDASLNLGQAFMPIIDKAIPILQDFADVVLDITTGMKEFSRTIFGVEENEQKLLDTGNKAGDSQKKIAKGIDKVTASARKSLAPFDKLNNLQEQMAKTTTDTIKKTEKKEGEDGIGGFAPALPGPITGGEIRTQAVKQYAKELGIVVKDLTTIFKNFGAAWDEFNKPIEVGEGFFDRLKKQASESKKVLFGLKTGLGVIEPQINSYNQALDNSQAKTNETLGNMNQQFNGFFDGLMKAPWHDVELKWHKGFGNIEKNMGIQMGRVETDIDNKMENIKEKDWSGVQTSWEDAWGDIRTGIDTQLDGIETDVEETTSNIQKQVNKMRSALSSVTGVPGISEPKTTRGETLPAYRLIDDNIDTDFLDEPVRDLGPVPTQGTGGANNMPPIELKVNLDTKEVARGIFDPLNAEAQRRGSKVTESLIGSNPLLSPFFR